MYFFRTSVFCPRALRALFYIDSLTRKRGAARIIPSHSPFPIPSPLIPPSQIPPPQIPPSQIPLPIIPPSPVPPSRHPGQFDYYGTT